MPRTANPQGSNVRGSSCHSSGSVSPSQAGSLQLGVNEKPQASSGIRKGRQWSWCSSDVGPWKLVGWGWDPKPPTTAMVSGPRILECNQDRDEASVSCGRPHLGEINSSKGRDLTR